MKGKIRRLCSNKASKVDIKIHKSHQNSRDEVSIILGQPAAKDGLKSLKYDQISSARLPILFPAQSHHCVPYLIHI